MAGVLPRTTVAVQPRKGSCVPRHAHIRSQLLTTMILRGWHLCCLLSTLFAVVLAQNPTHSINSFQNLPGRLFFFDDSETAVYLDSVEGILYVTQDEGKSWNAAPDIPKGDAAMVIEHPFDNRYVRTGAFFYRETC